MPLRDFDAEKQATPWKQVAVQTEVRYIELRCPDCKQRSYAPNRRRPLSRTGSEREYAVCLDCGLKLTRGRAATLPTSGWGRLKFWRRLSGQTLEAKV